jgi:hypothetical protein
MSLKLYTLTNLVARFGISGSNSIKGFNAIKEGGKGRKKNEN